jgi:tetratricopeptide (TPR) repeat protein
MKTFKKLIYTGFILLSMVTSGWSQTLAEAKEAIHQEQYDKAKNLLEQLIAKENSNGDVYFYLGEVHLQLGYPDSAQMTFQQGNNLDPKNPINKIGLGTIELLNGNSNGAQSLFEQVTKDLKKKDYEELLYIGKAYLKGDQPQYQKALEYLNQAKEINKSDAEIDLAIGNAHYGLGQNSEAYTAYRNAYNLDNSLVGARVQLAVISKQARAYEEAVHELKNIASEKPDFAPTYRELAETYYLWSRGSTTTDDYDEKLKEALANYKKFMDLTDYSLESRMRYADFLILAKDYTTLEVQANEMTKLDKVNPRILRYLGYAAYENGNYKESEQALNEFISKVDPERLIARDFLFLGLAGLRQRAEGTASNEATLNTSYEHLTKAVEMDPTIAEDMNVIGMEFFKDQKYRIAAKVFEAATSNPESKNYLFDYFYLGYSLYFDYALNADKEPKPDPALLVKADEAFAKVNELAPTTEAAFLYRAKVNRLLDNNDKPEGLFVPHYQSFIDIVNQKGENTINQNKANLVEAYSVIGAFHTLNGEYEKARENFQSALAIEPSNEYAKQALANLEPASK